MDWILRDILYESKLPRVQVTAIDTLRAPSPFEMASHLNECLDVSMSLLEHVMPGTSGRQDSCWQYPGSSKIFHVYSLDFGLKRMFRCKIRNIYLDLKQLAREHLSLEKEAQTC